jgi:hypothetical protein
MRIGADAQHLGIDEFDRQIAGFVDLRARDIAPDEYGEDRQYCDRQPAPLSGICHQKLLHFRPTMVANFGKNIGNPDEPGSVEAADRENAKLVNWSPQQE